jgi:hypothetical protein
LRKKVSICYETINFEGETGQIQNSKFKIQNSLSRRAKLNWSAGILARVSFTPERAGGSKMPALQFLELYFVRLLKVAQGDKENSVGWNERNE